MTALQPTDIDAETNNASNISQPSDPWAEPAWTAAEPDVAGPELISLSETGAHLASTERVRFSAPARLRSENDGRTADGFVLNLSVSGVAALLPLELGRGERVWLQFALGLGDGPMELLAQVVWHREQDEGTLYGLQFVSLTDAERAEIEAAVRERSEGRAAAWPLPVVEPDDAEAGASRPRTLVAVAGGMAAGMVLALAVSLLAPPSESSAEDMPLQARDDVGGVRLAGDARRGAATSSERPEQTDVAATATPEPQRTPQPKAPAEANAAENPDARDAAAKRKEVLGPRDPEAAPQPPNRSAAAASVEPLQLMLKTDGRVERFETFWLSNPRRLVVDVHGRKSAFEHDQIDVDHPLAERVRVGRHPQKVRFVIDAAASVAEGVEIRRANSGLRLRLRPKRR